MAHRQLTPVLKNSQSKSDLKFCFHLKSANRITKLPIIIRKLKKEKDTIIQVKKPNEKPKGVTETIGIVGLS